MDLWLKIQILLTDQCHSLHSKDFQTFLTKQNINLVFPRTNCSQSNGLKEGLNQTQVNRIRRRLYRKPSESLVRGSSRM